jgi:radical SAM family uncharacterized protein
MPPTETVPSSVAPARPFRNEAIRRALLPILPRVEKPGRYLALERNVVVKDPASVRLRVCLAFPEAYEIGMSHTGLKVLHHVLNRRPDVACERTYAPWIDMEGAMKEAGIPLFSVDSLSPVRDFDLVGFSLQSELNYTNVPNLLRLAGIPVRARDRKDADPIVVGGGPCVANPEPLADFFDAFLLGDAEEALPELIDALLAAREGNESREETLLRVARIPGWYVPGFYDCAWNADGTVAGYRPNRSGVPDKPRRRWVERLSPDVQPDRALVPSVEIVQERLGLEIMRGCTQGCRFCQAGYWYRPVRELDPDDVARMTKRFVDEAGWSEVSLLSLSSADYSQIEPLAGALARDLAPRRVSISLPSLRADAFNVALADAVSEVRKSGFTFAPETGSDRLRRVLNKSFTNADMVAAAEVAFARGWDLIKVYTMIGLPTETDADLDDLVRLIDDILRASRRTPGRKEVKVSVGCFVPKSWTPFQWDRFDGIPELERKIRYLRDRFRRLRGARITNHEPREAEIEAILSRGDRRLGAAIERASELGATFDGWSERFRYDLWCQALEECGCDRVHYTREIGEQEHLPWEVMDSSITRTFLQVERKKGLREMETQDCKWGHCYACGIPGLGADTVLANPMERMAERSGGPAPDPSFSGVRPAESGELFSSPPEGVPAGAASDPGAETTPATPRNPGDPAPSASSGGESLPPASSFEVSSGRKSAAIRRAELEAARAGKAKGAAWQLRAKPDLPPLEKLAPPGFRKGEGGPLFRTRLRFSKSGEWRFLSHRNVMDCFERALRAAAVPMRYSEGFNPHPKMSMGPALPLGQECFADPFDIETSAPFEAAHLDAMNEKLPEGLRLVSFEPIREPAKGMGKLSPRGVYAISPGESFPGDWSPLLDRVGAAMASPSPDGAPRLALRGDGSIALTIPLAGERATSPKKALEELLGLLPDSQLDLRIVRERVELEG